MQDAPHLAFSQSAAYLCCRRCGRQLSLRRTAFKMPPWSSSRHQRRRRGMHCQTSCGRQTRRAGASATCRSARGRAGWGKSNCCPRFYWGVLHGDTGLTDTQAATGSLPTLRRRASGGLEALARPELRRRGHIMSTVLIVRTHSCQL